MPGSGNSNTNPPQKSLYIHVYSLVLRLSPLHNKGETLGRRLHNNYCTCVCVPTLSIFWHNVIQCRALYYCCTLQLGIYKYYIAVTQTNDKC